MAGHNKCPWTVIYKIRVSETASACGQTSVVHSLPQLQWSGATAGGLEKMFYIVIYPVKQLIVGVFRRIWRTKSTALDAANKRIDSLSVCCRDEAAPRKGHVEYLSNNTDRKTACRPASWVVGNLTVLRHRIANFTPTNTHVAELPQWITHFLMKQSNNETIFDETMKQFWMKHFYHRMHYHR